MPATQIDFADLVSTLRKRLGLSQEKLASQLGMTIMTVSRWERGISKPSPLALKQIQQLLEEMGDRGKDLQQQYFPENQHF